MRTASPAAFTAASAAVVCIRVSPVPPDFEIATKRVVASGNFVEQRGVAVGVEVVHEMQARAVAKGADAFDGVVGELGEGLPAEARSTGAEDDDVGRVAGEPRRGGADRVDIVVPRRQPQQGQRAVGMPRPDPVERAGAARQRLVQCGGSTPWGPTRSARAWSMDWRSGMPSHLACSAMY